MKTRKLGQIFRFPSCYLGSRDFWRCYWTFCKIPKFLHWNDNWNVYSGEKVKLIIKHFYILIHLKSAVTPIIYLIGPMASSKLKNNKAIKEEPKSKKTNSQIKQMKYTSKKLFEEPNSNIRNSPPIRQEECYYKKQFVFVKECLSR